MKRVTPYIFTFILGGLVVGVVVWNVARVSFERSTELLMTTAETATLERDLELLTLPEKELRCRLSKLSRTKNLELSKLADDIGPSPLFVGAPSLALYTEKFIKETASKYHDTNIEGFANECVSNTKLYR